MNGQDDTDRLRDQIARDQGWTLCYCTARTGAIPRPLELCADCRDWLVEHSPRIVRAWRYWMLNHALTPRPWSGQISADAAEADDRAYFGL